MATKNSDKPDEQGLRMLKHDIKNQLSNIHLALEGLRYEVDDIGGDIGLYIETMLQSAQKIDQLLEVIREDK